MDILAHPIASEVLRIAVASSDGERIDLHFGQADAFHIYTLAGADLHFLETRVVEHYCRGGGLEEDGEDQRRAMILRTIADCAALFVARAGLGPTRRLEAAGIEPVSRYAQERIEPSIRDWSKSHGALA